MSQSAPLLPTTPPPVPDTRLGATCAIGAFALWGVLPVYFKLLGPVGALEIVAHRVVWSALLLGLAVTLLRRGAAWRRTCGRWRVLLATTTLISLNWLVFIWAVLNHQLVQASLGYFINPLVNVVLGMVFLGERLNPTQRTAVLTAAFGVLVLVLSVGEVPWLGLTLAFSFGGYALLRKWAGIDPLLGLLGETALLAPAAAGYLLWLGPDGSFATIGPGTDALLLLAGVVTAVPLVLFLYGASRLRLGTLGLMQYLTPTCHLLLGLLAYGEPFSLPHLAAFAFIWSGLALFSYDGLRNGNGRR